VYFKLQVVYDLTVCDTQIAPERFSLRWPFFARSRLRVSHKVWNIVRAVHYGGLVPMLFGLSNSSQESHDGRSWRLKMNVEMRVDELIRLTIFEETCDESTLYQCVWTVGPMETR